MDQTNVETDVEVKLGISFSESRALTNSATPPPNPLATALILKSKEEFNLELSRTNPAASFARTTEPHKLPMHQRCSNKDKNNKERIIPHLYNFREKFTEGFIF